MNNFKKWLAHLKIFYDTSFKSVCNQKRQKQKCRLTAVAFVGAGQAAVSVTTVILTIAAPRERDALTRVTAELVRRAVWH